MRSLSVVNTCVACVCLSYPGGPWLPCITRHCKIKRYISAAGLQYLSNTLVKNCGKCPVTLELCPTCAECSVYKIVRHLCVCIYYLRLYAFHDSHKYKTLFTTTCNTTRLFVKPMHSYSHHFHIFAPPCVLQITSDPPIYHKVKEPQKNTIHFWTCH
jgi:hypothetical protein